MAVAARTPAMSRHGPSGGDGSRGGSGKRDLSSGGSGWRDRSSNGSGWRDPSSDDGLNLRYNKIWLHDSLMLQVLPTASKNPNWTSEVAQISPPTLGNLISLP